MEARITAAITATTTRTTTTTVATATVITTTTAVPAPTIMGIMIIQEVVQVITRATILMEMRLTAMNFKR